MKNIVIFASGSGSNAENIIKYFKNDREIRVVALFCNRPNAFVLERIKGFDIPAFIFNREDFTSDRVLDRLKTLKVDLVVLAGFLWKVPPHILEAFPHQVINIHPALLPAHGGQGMYGMRVHEAVIARGDGESGITIHYVNERYDEGTVIFQAACAIAPGETPESLAGKIHALEQAHFPAVIKRLLENK
ncbi:MAG: phosphoribosylglycinamide formyltransferase [Odoribacteraceae bacterium]|jgi:phosphoribosylglycinamide formyltransferase-1|nr:phosphoribosylglycinamide formyltransferase [Odoribacteraceae bacterium]